MLQRTTVGARNPRLGMFVVCCYGSITENENIRQFVVIRCNSTFISTFNLSTSDDLKYLTLRHLLRHFGFSE